MYSRWSVCFLLLLLDVTPALASSGGYLAAAQRLSWNYLTGTLVSHPWLCCSLVLAALLAVAGGSSEAEAPRSPRRRFRAPNLTRFRRLTPRNHEDLEV